MPSVRFVDVAVQAGLGRARNTFGPARNKQFLLEEMGCGVASFDYDNDGWLDIFLVNGTTFEEARRGAKPTSFLFKNNRDGTFTDVTEQAGFSYSGWGQACCVGDYDNDGFDDLFVSYWGQNVLYHNNGDGTFTDVSEAAGVAGDALRWGAGCCFLDYDRDGPITTIRMEPSARLQWRRDARSMKTGLPLAAWVSALPTMTATAGSISCARTSRTRSQRYIAITGTVLSTMPACKRAWASIPSYTKYVGFDAGFFDYDNDGWEDIFLANGHVYAQLSGRKLHITYEQPTLLYRNLRNG